MEPIDRRTFLRWGAAAGAALVTSSRLALAKDAYAPPAALASALATSPLVYISPLRSDGEESRCHGEVWFVAEGSDVLVVTAADRYRARAVQAGQTGARVWVGDHGVWTVSDGAFLKAPTARAEGSVVASEGHGQALAAFGTKYPDEWGKWGPRFEKGLGDGSRVLLRYRVVGP
jgi:hypothetical protein